MRTGMFILVLLLAASSVYAESGVANSEDDYKRVCERCRQEAIDLSRGGEKHQGIMSACFCRNKPNRIHYSYYVAPVRIGMSYLGRSVSDVRQAAERGCGGCNAEPVSRACLQR
jgi:hypothetical protein